MNQPVVLIAGGGTGGHLFPGIAVGQALTALRPGLQVVFVSAGKALESQALQRAGFPLEALAVTAFRGRGLVDRLRSLARVPAAVQKARGLLARWRPGLVLAVGGYASLPLGLAARLARVPLAVQEQNAVPGLVNRVLARLARRVFISFPGAEAHLGRGASRALLLGNPVRGDLLAQARQAARERPMASREFRVLVLGGSQGAASLNRALVEALPRLAERRDRLYITHQTGPADEEKVREAYRAAGFRAQVGAFFPEMGRHYGLAHLVFCRAGAGTLTEVLAVGRAAVAVPYPHAAGDHQTANARVLEAAGAALLLPDAALTGETAAAQIIRLMDGRQEREALEARAGSLARPAAAQDIARECLALMEGEAHV